MQQHLKHGETWRNMEKLEKLLKVSHATKTECLLLYKYLQASTSKYLD